MRRPDADLTLDIEGDSFAPGETVMGRITLSSKKGLKVRTGTVRLECIEKFWKTEYDPATKTTRPKEKSQKLAEFSVQIMNEVEVRSSIPLVEDVKFTLPDDAHRSVLGKTANISWQIEVSLDVPGARDLHSEKELTVVPQRQEQGTVARRDETPVSVDESFDECRLRIEAPSGEYRPGDVVSGRLRLDALEECSFPEVRVELVREEKAGDKLTGDVADSTVLETNASFRANLSREWRFSLSLPDELLPTTSHSKSTLAWKLRGTLARSRRRDHAVEAEITVR